MRGTPIATVGELLGHKSLSMTMRYAHLSPAHKAEAVKSLDKNLTKVGLNPSEAQEIPKIAM